MILDGILIIIIITMPGGYELTDMDVLKLQKMYGCDGACGGWAKSEDGGFSNEIIVLTFVCVFSYSKFFNVLVKYQTSYQESLRERTVTTKAHVNGFWRHPLGRWTNFFCPNKEKHYKLSSGCQVRYNTGGNYLGTCQEDE